jgi:plasmid stability protein
MMYAEAIMNRTQLLLDDEQDRRLREMAARQNKSLSETLRQILDEYFAEQDRRTREEALKTLDKLDRIREEATAKYGLFEGEPVHEAREERQRQAEDVWEQQS